MIEGIHYDRVAVPRFRDETRQALDALRRECNYVTIRALSPQADSCWEVELTGVSDSRLSYSMRGMTVDEAARRLARWRGIDIAS